MTEPVTHPRADPVSEWPWPTSHHAPWHSLPDRDSAVPAANPPSCTMALPASSAPAVDCGAC